MEDLLSKFKRKTRKNKKTGVTFPALFQYRASYDGVEVEKWKIYKKSNI